VAADGPGSVTCSVSLFVGSCPGIVVFGLSTWKSQAGAQSSCDCAGSSLAGSPPPPFPTARKHGTPRGVGRWGTSLWCWADVPGG